MAKNPYVGVGIEGGRPAIVVSEATSEVSSFMCMLAGQTRLAPQHWAGQASPIMEIRMNLRARKTAPTCRQQTAQSPLARRSGRLWALYR